MLIMDDKQATIGLTKLLDEITTDLDELRKKHPGDYNIKNITMWWELERERVLARYSPGFMVKKLRRIQGIKRMMMLFFAGWLTMIGVQTVIRLLIP